MAIPAQTKLFAESMDPYDVVDFEADLAGLLEPGETIASATLLIPTESSLLGLTLNTSGGYETILTGTVLKFWLSIDEGDQNNKAFEAGVTLPIEVRVTTNFVPPRKKQRTMAVMVVQR